MAISLTETWMCVMGDKYVAHYTITHDGSSTTFTAPMGTVDEVVVFRQYGTNSTEVTASASGSTVTVSAAGTSGDTDKLMLYGSA